MTAKKTKSTNAQTALTKLRDVQIDLPAVEFKDAAQFKVAYDAANQAVKQSADASVDNQAELIAALATMRSLLSQRGSEKIRREAGVTQGWTQYFQWFQRTYKFNLCLRTVINKIDRLNGKKFCPSCNKADGHTPSCPKYKKPAPQLSVKESRLLAAISAAHDFAKAVEHGGNSQEAAREYKKWAPTPERLEEWVSQQVIPYQPEPGDVLLVNGQEFTLLELRGVSQQGHEHLLTIAIEPVRQPHTASMTPAKAPSNAASPASTVSVKASKAAAA